jgi:hypothetical protein
MKNTRKIIQIIPAHGWQDVYTHADGSETKTPLSMWGLYDDGEVVGMDTILDGDGPYDCTVSDLFARYEREGTI